MVETNTYKGHTYTNGNVPSTVLKKINGQHGTKRNMDAYLRDDAADSMNRVIAEIKEKYGDDLTLRGWMRNKAEQESAFWPRVTRVPNRNPTRVYKGIRYWLKGAAVATPGYSNHGWGTTVDIDNFGGVGQFNHPRYKKYQAILKKHGWNNTEGKRIREPWHWSYNPKDDKGKNSGNHSAGNKKYHWRETTKPTHLYGKLGKNGGTKQGRLLPAGYRFTVKNGSGRKRGDEWWVQTTSGNWLRSAKTKEI